jgi:hypothetical protein
MSFWNPFKSKDEPASAPSKEKEKTADVVPELPKELTDSPEAKGMMAMFYRKWKDPSFVKQLKTLAAHMQKDGVNIKSMNDVKAWLEKNKDAIDAGKFKEPPPMPGGKVETFVKTGPDVGRNDPCTCGSGKKYKKCCGAKA